MTAAAVTHKVDSSGNVCFAGTNYRVGPQYRRRQVQVAVVGDTVEIGLGDQIIRSHRVRAITSSSVTRTSTRRPTRRGFTE